MVTEKSKYSNLNYQEIKSFIFLYNFMNKNLNHLTTPRFRGGRDRLPKTPAAWGCSSRSTSQRMLYHTDCVGEDTKTNFRKIHSISPSLSLSLSLCCKARVARSTLRPGKEETCEDESNEPSN